MMMARKRSSKFLILMFLSALFLFDAAGPAVSQSSAGKDTIRVLILESFPPQFISTPEGPSGLAVEVIKEVSRRVSLNIEFVTVKSWKEVYAPLENGTVDVLSSMGISEARKKIVEFTSPYEVFHIKLFVRKETTDIKSLDDLGGRLLGVQATNILSKGLIESGKYKIKTYPTFQMAFLGLLAGEIDAVPAPTEPFLRFARAARLDERIQPVGSSLLEVKRAMAVPKGQTELRDLLNKGLDEFKQTEEYKTLLTKWYGTPTPFWTLVRIVALMAAILISTLLIMATWRYYSIIGLNRRIQESEKRFRDFAESSSDWFWEMDENLRFTNVTKGYRTSIEIDPKVYTGKTRQEASTDNLESEKWIQHIDDLENYRPFHNFTYEIITPSGIRATVRTHGKPVFDQDGVFCGYRGTGTDITESKILEEQLRQSQKMEAVGHLAGGVAHDFNNLLAVVIGNVDLLKHKFKEGEKAAHHIEAIARAVDRGASLTQRLLAFSRRQTLVPQPTALNDLVLGLEDMLQRTLGETIELNTRLGSGTCEALIDPHQFEDALVNLSINSRDAMANGGVLTIETANVSLDEVYAEQHQGAWPGDYVMVTIRDTGTGMPPEILENVFEPFFTTKDVGKGSGLGLSMVYGFVKQSGGYITINSEVDHGTIIELYLPRSKEAMANEPFKDEAPKFATASERILVVEDDEDVRDISTSILREQGYEIVEAKDGREAISYLENGQSFDLLFTDVVLPGGISGMEIADKAKRLQTNIKVLYTSGYAEGATGNVSKGNHGATMISKPFHREEMLEKVRCVLDGNDS